MVAPLSSYALTVTLSPDSPLDGVLTLYDASGTQIDRSDFASAGGDEVVSSNNITSGDTFYVRVGSADYLSTGDYLLEVAFELAVPGQLTGAPEGFAYFHHDGISHDTQVITNSPFALEVGSDADIFGGFCLPTPCIDVDTFTFAGRSGWNGNYTIHVEPVVPGALQPVVAVYNLVSGDLLGFDADTGPNDDTELTLSLTGLQRYVLVVADDDGADTGDVEITIDAPSSGPVTTIDLDDFGDGPATPLPALLTLTNTTGDTDFFELIAPAAATRDLIVIVTPTQALHDVAAVLFDAAGNEIAKSYLNGFGPEMINVSGLIPSTAYYLTVLATDYGSVGSYEIAVDFDLATGSIAGTKYNDLNANAVMDSGESGLPDWLIFVDQDGDGEFDLAGGIEPDDFGAGSLMNTVAPGVTLSAVGTAVTNANVTAVNNPSFSTTGTKVFANSWLNSFRQFMAGLRVDFAAPISTVTIDFIGDSAALDIGELAAYSSDNTLLDVTTTAALSAGNGETMTITRPAADIAYIKAYGQANNGGRLDNLTYGTGVLTEPFDVTDASGAYLIENLPVNQTHTVREAMQVGWQQSAPASVSHIVTITVVNPDVTGFDFGNYEPATIRGRKYHDLDSDGVLDPGEPGLDTWSIYVDLNNDGVRDPNEPVDFTSSGGFYAIAGVPPGTWNVREEVQPGWEPTNPVGGVQSVAATANTLINNIDFLNRELLDFGDAPDPTFPTLLGSGGARHRIIPGLRLGQANDDELDGQPDPNALGDDNDGSNDDDGVAFVSALVAGQSVTLEVTASQDGGLLDAWVDFNADGDWSDPGERIFNNRPLLLGVNVLSVTIPATATVGNTFARFRYSLNGVASFDGHARSGEVEDYLVAIVA